MRVVIDTERCVMAGECVYNHPSLFGWGDDGFPAVQVADLTSDTERLEARQAREVCPSGAISIVDP